MLEAIDEGYQNLVRNEEFKNTVDTNDIAVEANGRALRVHAGETPHLVSLGSDRFSTAVTVHPIPKGRTSVGSSSTADIPVYGTGVQELHCWIEHKDGIVTAHPNGDNVQILIDGLKVLQPTRLTQGSMLCLGRSNFFRFNHPQEARLMKSVLPNTRVSMMPNSFCPTPDDASIISEDKTSNESRRSYESDWCDSSCTSTEDLLRPTRMPGSSNLNSPASVVLGRHKGSTRGYNSVTVYEDGCKNDRNNNVTSRFSSTESLRQRIVPPSPAFDRNPSYGRRSSPEYGTFASSPLSASSPRFANGRGDRNGSLSSPTGSYESVDTYRNSGTKRKQAHQTKLQEQERERIERLRLEEILNTCADYERQVQNDRSKTPVRIKTNGSLPRDKQSLSPVPQTPDAPHNGLIFNFEKQDVKSDSTSSIANGDKLSYPSSPRTRIKTVASPKIVRKERPLLEILENKLAQLNDRDPKASLRRPVAESVNGLAMAEPKSIVERNTLKKYEFLGIDPNSIDEMTRSCPNAGSSTETTTLIDFPRTNGYANCSGDIARLNGLVMELNQFVKETSTINFKDSKRAANYGKVESNSRFKSFEDTCLVNGNDSKYILPLEEIDTALRRQRFGMKKSELKRLQTEQSRLKDAINNVKNKLLDIEQQKNEIIRELEMEKALLEGELKAESDKLAVDEESLNNIQGRMVECEKKIENCSKQQTDRQSQNKKILNEQQDILNVLQSNLSCINNEDDRASILESIKRSREILEEETKSFEDFEFHLLEEEATLLSKRDELQTEINASKSVIEDMKEKINGFRTQKEQLLQNASDEIKALEIQVHFHTRTLQQNRSRLQDISTELRETSKSLSEISEDATDDETCTYRTQSQEDLDRISRVTSDAPLMEVGSSNSLGRKTIASLQQIEKTRQMHLVQQGSHVIEEERKRVLALKRRVQDEVKAQWEEDRKQREINCSSITSIGSDNSSTTSCERIADSPGKTSETTNETSDKSNFESTKEETSSSKDDKPEEKYSNYKRPSNASVISIENGSATKLRTQKSNSKRPESRFSAHRRQSLDLRQHIESAGHQVDHCPHVFVDKTSCRGYLQKMTTKFRTWNKRWFVFDRKKCAFTYYSDKNEKKLKGGAYFQGLLDLCIDSTNSIKSPNPQATFIVKTTERVFYLFAPSIEAMRIWFDVLATEVEPYQGDS